MTTKTYTFQDLQKSIMENFKKMGTLFYVDINREEIVETYLNAFDPELRQGNNCNCCKSFLRQFGGLGTIKDNKFISIFDDVDTDEEYGAPLKALQDYIHSRPVTDRFYVEESKTGRNLGTKQNVALKTQIRWNHFYLEAPAPFFQV